MAVRSQLKQDVFAFSVAKNKSYIEIGAWHPEKYSNTYELEVNGWNGFSLEIAESKKPFWDNCQERKNTVYWTDALQFDYQNALAENNLSNRVGYLSCDIEPPENTFAALKRVIEQGIIFDCITFEHDKYQSDINYDPIVTNYLKEHGYKVAVSDVYRFRKYRVSGQKRKNQKKCIMETWFVNEDIPYTTIDYTEWLDNNIRK